MNIALLRVDAQCTASGAPCPECGTWPSRVHGSYLRYPADVPSAARSVVLRLLVRRFICQNVSCGRQTFAEQGAVVTCSCTSSNAAAAISSS
ncbi:transposase family protein [Streptomyces phaeoluteigriseus]|uniref:Transposase family protein n=1 Tax=Streptomyces phaeoluteigriseus TaxID=114686 RepID=A0ABY4ZLQ5_9ACTN|nr:transposase family protein [Streptomyces phaeoluteigriseus]USQ89640.1 transposase family protein [Streptomyces phaeoluteigriseus]